MDLFTKVLQQPVEIIPPEDMDDAHNHPAWKARKWVAVRSTAPVAIRSHVPICTEWRCNAGVYSPFVREIWGPKNCGATLAKADCEICGAIHEGTYTSAVQESGLVSDL